MFNSSQMLALRPALGRALVEIREKYQHVATTEQKYDTRTSGVLLRFNCVNKLDKLSDYYENQVGKLVFWEEYKDGQIIERDGKKYAFIKLEDLDGYEDEQVS